MDLMVRYIIELQNKIYVIVMSNDLMTYEHVLLLYSPVLWTSHSWDLKKNT